MKKLEKILKGFQKNYEGEIILHFDDLADIEFSLSTIRTYARKMGYSTKLVKDGFDHTLILS